MTNKPGSFCSSCKAPSTASSMRTAFSPPDTSKYNWQYCGMCHRTRKFIRGVEVSQGPMRRGPRYGSVIDAKNKLKGLRSPDERQVWAIHGPLNNWNGKTSLIELVDGTYEKACEYAVTLPIFFDFHEKSGSVVPAKKTPVRKLEE